MKAFFILLITAFMVGLFYVFIPISLDFNEETTKVYSCTNYGVKSFIIQSQGMSRDSLENEVYTNIFDKNFISVSHDENEGIPRSYECILLAGDSLEKEKEEKFYAMYVFAKTWWGSMKEDDNYDVPGDLLP